MSIYDDIRDEFEGHLLNQPYEVKDSNGDDVDYSTEVDEDGDIIITIDLSEKDNRPTFETSKDSTLTHPPQPFSASLKQPLQPATPKVGRTH